MTTIYDPMNLGAVTLKNRIIMAPMTRGRAGSSGVPGELMATYYAQRASAGLLIAEATAVSADGRGWLNSPGLFNDEQQAGWSSVAESVHQAGGKLFVQLWHMGATVHPDFLDGDKAVSSSAIRPKGKHATPLGEGRELGTARPLSIEGISIQVQNFARAARRAIDAGLDGVEIHAANGYLIDQFTRDSCNLRTDDYGGNIDNRLRFMREVVAAVCKAIGADKVGIRLSPTNVSWGVSDSQYQETFTQAVKQLNEFGLAYLHLLEHLPGTEKAVAKLDYLTPQLRKYFDGPVLVNGGYSPESAQKALDSDLADGVAFGVPFIANPDLVARFETGSELAVPESQYFYTPDSAGYTDYESQSPCRICI
ncbi:alkene reductase [Granulosicoccus antarcticus]|uniref:N-ethylmaleimide reductase n=1 Tax=Granulosicoccus antarcticus IMCC3135 TaxID=1192854 RepID=A0A2Z2NH67_9GAMM|nr:alkene reductase [Granulosicoccus antarcticus]ASJ70636.1 N-ethylmaleimide reductase [Granulosicoccus antarcticus IMCC3135]